MRSLSLPSGTALGALLPLVRLVAGQWAPGGSYFDGHGAPAAAPYRLVDDYTPAGFFDKFTFYDEYDPTYGHVKYVNRDVATTNGYAYYSATNNSAVIRPDTTNTWPPGYLGNDRWLPGRPSVRLESFNTYHHGLFIFDASHIPTGCGTWPAYWLLGPSWPANGEIDIIEGVHTSTYNTMALHTTANCTIAGSGQTGTFTHSNCDHAAEGNIGCGSQLQNTTANPNNYGPDFNANRGGVYATEWTSNYIKHWWFPRGQIPASITAGRPDIASFGTPAVNAQGSCDIDSHFRNMSIIINIDFCGAWAGSVYDQWGSCPQNVPKTTEDTPNNRCAAFVGDYPERFTEAYWEINRIQVYQMPADVATTSTYSTSLSTVIPVGQSTNTFPIGMGATTSTLPPAPPYTGPLTSPTSSAPVPVATGAACPQYNNSVVADAAGYQYTVLCGKDYDASSAHISTTPSFDACLVACDGWPGCLAVTFIPSDLAQAPNGRGVCFSKEASPAPLMNNPNAYTARRVGGPAQPGAIVNTSNRPTSNIGASGISNTLASSSGNNPPALTSSAGGAASTTALGPANFSCPANHGQIVQDNCGVNYIIGCDRDTLSDGSTVSFIADTFNLCFEACSSGSNGICTGFVWHQRFCYLKAPTIATDDFAISAGRIAVINTNFYRAPRGGSLPANTIRSCAVLVTSTTTTTRSTTSSSSRSSSSSVQASVYSSQVFSSSFQVTPSLTTRSTTTSSSRSSSSSAQAPVYSTQAFSSPSQIIPPSSSSPSSPLVPASSAYLSSSSVVFTADSTWVSSGTTYTSAWPLTTVSNIQPPAYSSLVTFVSTTYATWTSEGVTYSSAFPVTIATTASEQQPSQASSLSSSSEQQITSTAPETVVSENTSTAPTDSSTSQLASSSEIPAPSEPPSYSTVQIETTVLSTTISEYTSDGIAYSSTFAITSVSSSIISSPAATSSAAPPPPCPVSYEGACGAPAESPNPYCSSSSGNTFAVQCGVGYRGTTIPDNQINVTVVSDSYKRDVIPGFAKRIPVPNYASCQATCENTASCVAFQFVPQSADNCILFSEVTSTYELPGAVGGAAVEDISNPPSYVLPTSSTSTSALQSSSSSAGPPPTYGGGASVTTTVTNTPTYYPGPTTTIPLSSETSAASITTTIFSTLPSGGSFTTSGTSSFYVITSATGGSCSSSICFTCGLTPIVTSGCDVSLPPTSLPSLPPLVTGGSSTITGTVPTTSSRPFSSTRDSANAPSVITTRIADTCPRVVSGTGYTTIFTTYTMTTCLPGEVCANPGYVIIPGTTSEPGQVVVTTTNGQGSSVTYTIVPTNPPSVTDLPGCAQQCIIDFGPCRPSDVNCICKNQSFLQSVTDCVAARCSNAEIQACISYATKLCRDNGVPTLPTANVSYTGTGVATRTSSRPVPSITELPSCAQGCVADFRPCDASDVHCICTNQPYLSSIRNCIANGCSDASINDVIVFANNLCSGYGITALPTAGISHTGTLTLTQTAVVTRTAVTAVPSITDLPSCAQNCVIDYGNCDPQDVRCICENKPYLDSIIGCVMSGCDQTTIRDLFNFADSLCGGYGVEITTIISYVPTTVYQPTTVLSTYITTAPGGSLIIGTSTAVITRPGEGPGTEVATVTQGPPVTVTGGPSNLPRCPFNNGQSYIDGNGQVYIITCDTGFTDATLETSSQPRFVDCMSRCDAYNTLTSNAQQQCGGISFISAQTTDNCLLQIGDAIANAPGVWSGRLISRAAVPPTNGSGPGSGPAPTSYLISTAVQGTGPGTGPAPTQYIPGSTIYGTTTALSTIVSNGLTYTSVYGLTTVLSISYATVTTTTLSLQPTTIAAGTATVTAAGPTVTATPTGPGFIVTVTQGGGGGGVVTSIIYVQPSSTSSSRTCRLTPTNYLKGLEPVKRRKKRDDDGDDDDEKIFDLGSLRDVPAALPGARPAFR